MRGGAQRAPGEPSEGHAPLLRGDDAPALPGVGSAGAAAASAPAPDPHAGERDFERLLPATAVACRLRLTPAANMSSAVLTGLGMLAREGRIRLEVEIVPDAPPLEQGPWHLRDKQRPQPALELDGGGSAVIDGHDSWEIETQDLLRHDLYFKRSLRPESMRMPRGERLRTLGLLNEVRADFVDVAELRSELGAAGSAAQRVRIFLRWVAWCGAARVGLGGRPNWSRMHAPPVPGQSQRVLLMTGLWDPAQVPATEAAQRAGRLAVRSPGLA